MADPADADALYRALLRDGRPEAFRVLVKLYTPLVRAQIAAQVYRMDEVDDLAQEVFLAAFRGRRELGWADDVGAWLRGIARNKVLAHMRAAARRANALERFRGELQRLVADDLEALAAADRGPTTWTGRSGASTGCPTASAGSSTPGWTGPRLPPWPTNSGSPSAPCTT